MFVDEYDVSSIAAANGTSAVLRSILPLPTSFRWEVLSGSGGSRTVRLHYPCMGLSGSPLYLSRSVDEQYVLVPCYGVASGLVVVPGAKLASSPLVPRVIARIHVSGAVDTSTAFSDGFLGPVGALRGVASVDGGEYWVTGSGEAVDFSLLAAAGDDPWYASPGSGSLVMQSPSGSRTPLPSASPSRFASPDGPSAADAFLLSLRPPNITGGFNLTYCADDEVAYPFSVTTAATAAATSGPRNCSASEQQFPLPSAKHPWRGVRGSSAFLLGGVRYIRHGETHSVPVVPPPFVLVTSAGGQLIAAPQPSDASAPTSAEAVVIAHGSLFITTPSSDAVYVAQAGVDESDLTLGQAPGSSYTDGLPRPSYILGNSTDASVTAPVVRNVTGVASFRPLAGPATVANTTLLSIGSNITVSAAGGPFTVTQCASNAVPLSPAYAPGCVSDNGRGTLEVVVASEVITSEWSPANYAPYVVRQDVLDGWWRNVSVTCDVSEAGGTDCRTGWTLRVDESVEAVRSRLSIARSYYGRTTGLVSLAVQFAPSPSLYATMSPSEAPSWAYFSAPPDANATSDGMASWTLAASSSGSASRSASPVGSRVSSVSGAGNAPVTGLVPAWLACNKRQMFLISPWSGVPSTPVFYGTNGDMLSLSLAPIYPPSPSGTPSSSATPSTSLSWSVSGTATTTSTTSGTASGTGTVTGTGTATATATTSGISTATGTGSATSTGTGTPTLAPTVSASATGSATGSSTATSTGTAAGTPSGTTTASGTPPGPVSGIGSGAGTSATVTATIAATVTLTATLSRSGTSSLTLSSAASASASMTGTLSSTGTVTATQTTNASSATTWTPTGTQSATGSASPQSTLSPSATGTPTSSGTATGSRSATDSVTGTAAVLPTSPATPSGTSSGTANMTYTQTFTLISSLSGTSTVLGTLSRTGITTTNATGTGTATATTASSLSASTSASPSRTTTRSVTPSSTPTASPTGSMTATATATATPSKSRTGAVTVSGTASRTTTGSGSATGSASVSYTGTALSTRSPRPTATSTPSHTSTVSFGSTPSVSPVSTLTPSSSALPDPGDVLRASSLQFTAGSVRMLSSTLLNRPAPFVLSASASAGLGSWLASKSSDWAWDDCGSLSVFAGRFASRGACANVTFRSCAEGAACPLLRSSTSERISLLVDIALGNSSESPAAPLRSGTLVSSTLVHFAGKWDAGSHVFVASEGDVSAVNALAIARARVSLAAGVAPLVTGLTVNATFSWTLEGRAVPAFYPSPTVINEADAFHQLQTTTNGPLLTITAGSLRPGFVYVATARLLSAAAAWATDDALFLPAAVRSALFPGESAVENSLASIGSTAQWWNLAPRTHFHASVGRGASFLVRMPPFGGSVSVTPGYGIAIATRFSLITSGWKSEWDAHASHLEVKAGDNSASAILALASIPLPAGSIDALFTAAGLTQGSATLGTGYAWCLEQSAIAAGLPKPTTSTSSATAAWVNVTDYRWRRLSAFVTALYDSDDTTASICSLLAVRASNSTALFQPVASAFAQAPRVSFRAVGGGVAVNSVLDSAFHGGLAASAELASVQAGYRSAVSWPGSPLAPVSLFFNLTTLITSSAGTSSAMLAGNASAAFESGEALTVIAVVTDDEGGVGMAWAAITLDPFVTGAEASDPRALTARINDTWATLKDPVALGANPFLALQLVSTKAGAVTVSSAVLEGKTLTSMSVPLNASEAQAVRQTNIAIRAAMAGQLVLALSALNETASAGSGGSSSPGGRVNSADTIRIDDQCLAISAQAVADISSSAQEMSAAVADGALAATAAMLKLALPAQEGDVPESKSTTVLSAEHDYLPPLPRSVASNVMDTLVNILSAGNATSATLTDVGNSSSPAQSASVASRIADTLPSLGAALLRGVAADSEPTSAASGPAGAFGCAGAEPGHDSSFCGEALSLTSARISRGGNGSSLVCLSDPILPCRQQAQSSSGRRLNADSVTEGNNVSVRLPPAFLAAALRSSGLAGDSVDIHIVQWGATLHNETAGWAALSYSSTGACTSGVSSASDPVLRDQVAGLLQDCAGTRDFSPGGGLSSRTLSITLASRSGRTLPVNTSAVGADGGAINFMIPHRDPSSAGVVRNELLEPLPLLVTCPELGAPIGSPVTAAAVANASVTFSAGVFRVTNATITVPVAVTDEGRPARGPPSLGYGGQWFARPVTTNRTVLQAVLVPVYAVQVDCGAGRPGLVVTCGHASYGATTQAACPPLVTAPVCAYFDTAAAAWRTDGCTVVNSTPSGIECACTHLTDFGTRFSALGTSQEHVFAQALRLSDTRVFTSSTHVVVLVAIIVALVVFSLGATAWLDSLSARRFLSSLASDDEILFLRKVEELRGRAFVLDRVLDPPQGVGTSTGTQVTPSLDRGPSPSQTSPGPSPGRVGGPPAVLAGMSFYQSAIIHADVAARSATAVSAANPYRSRSLKRPDSRKLSVTAQEGGATNAQARTVALLRSASVKRVATPTQTLQISPGSGDGLGNSQPVVISVAAVTGPSNERATMRAQRIVSARSQQRIVFGSTLRQGGQPITVIPPGDHHVLPGAVRTPPQDGAQRAAEARVAYARVDSRLRVASSSVPSGPRTRHLWDGSAHVSRTSREGHASQRSSASDTADSSDLAEDADTLVVVARDGSAEGGEGSSLRAASSESASAVDDAQLGLSTHSRRMDSAGDADLTVAAMGSKRGLNPYAAALYLRLVRRFERHRVTMQAAADVIPHLPADIQHAIWPTTPGMPQPFGGSSVGPPAFAGLLRWQGGGGGADAGGPRLLDHIAQSGAAGAYLAGFGRQVQADVHRALARTNSGFQKAFTSTLDNVKHVANLLEDASAGVLMRAWRLKGLVWTVWTLQLLYHHTLVSAFTRYDPRLSRPSRVLLLASLLLGNLFITSLLYNWRNGGEIAALPPMEWSELAVVTLMSVAMQQPAIVLVSGLLLWAGEADFRYRYPAIHGELERRRRLEKRLAQLPVTALKRELNNGAGAEQHVPGGADDVTVAPQAITGAHGGAASHVKPTPPRVGFNLDSTEVAARSGWRDAPAACVRFCPLLLRGCNRHPSQKAAWATARHGEYEKIREAVKCERYRAEFATGRSLSEDSPADRELATLEIEHETWSRLQEEQTCSRVGSCLRTAAKVTLSVLTCGLLFRSALRKAAGRVSTGRGSRGSRASGSGRDVSEPGAGRPWDASNAGHPSLSRIYDEVTREVEGQTTQGSYCVLGCRAPSFLLRNTAQSGDDFLFTPWTWQSQITFAVAFAWCGWCVFYMVLWSLYQPREVVSSLLTSWGLTMAVSLILVEPLTKLALLVWAVLLWPALAPFLLWIPGVGPALGSRLSIASPSSGGDALSGRMAHLTLIRAAGYASSLTPDAAVVAYAANALLGSVLGAIGDSSNARSGNGCSGARKGLGQLSEQERYELTTRRYLLLQLRAAQESASAHKA